MKITIFCFLCCLLCSCGTTPQAQDPFDVALGMATLGIMQDVAPSDATMQSFSRAVAPPVVQQTIVQETVKQGGGQ
jgi:hypothetical protein